MLLVDEVTTPEFCEVTVERVDGIEYRKLDRPLKLELREVNAPEFADVVAGRLEVCEM
jgi:hypothetical protein